ncbi:MAG: phospholipase D-like domain-containing protein, partial [Bowdeniella nasicola]|nr:phospholipase D-like domain-containing protein [Bowdeniella nasicola]
ALTWLRLAMVAVAFIAQIAVLVIAIVFFTGKLPWLFTVHIIISALVIIWILASSMAPEYKISWSIPILLMPLVGGLFYLLYGRSYFTKGERESLMIPWQKSRALLDGVNHRGDMSAHCNAGARRIAHYLRSAAHYPAYGNTAVTYYPTGEDAWKAMLAELEQAEDYILFQYFIISAGTMWDELYAVLARKAAAGVKVHILYDDLGSVFTLPRNFEQTLHEAGVHVQPINPFGLKMLLRYNNRNHAKILVVDGKVGFTGGINIGDEYINITSPYGHWKDVAVRLHGPAVYSLAIMFATVWNAEKETLAWSSLAPSPHLSGEHARGWVQPYDDSPFDNLRVGQDAYIALLATAQESVDITSPYIIVDAEMTGAIIRAARSGVRIRIITSHIGDNWFVHETTRSSYAELVDAGVEIYEYEPGYMHAKMMIADGNSAIIGTINLDYRSLHLHQECAVWLYEVPAITHMTADFEATLASCLPITAETCAGIAWYRRALRAVLRTIAPLL